MADIQALAQQFTNYYYQTFDAQKDRSALATLYRPNSMLTWEGTQLQGAQAIIEKLSSLPFEKVQHKVTTFDAQPSSNTIASLIVLVTGQLVIDGGEAPMQYSQMFHLVPAEDSSYYVQNDVFRLVYG